MDSAQVAAPIIVISYLLLAILLIHVALLGLSDWLPIKASLTPQQSGELLLLLAVTSTLSSLARRLPWQNVLLSAAAIGFVGSAVWAILASPANAPAASAEHLFSTMQIFLAGLVWIVAVLNCRGVCALMLRRWRTAPGYGYWLLGLTIGMAVAALGVWTFGATVPSPFSMPVQWQFAKVLLGYVGGMFLTLLLATPTLINKRPGSQPANWHPLIVWTALNLFSLKFTLTNHLGLAAGLISAQTLVIMLLCRCVARPSSAAGSGGVPPPEETTGASRPVEMDAR